MLATYGPRVAVHRERHGVKKSGRNRLIVLHTSEGGEGHDRAEQLGYFLTLPATRDTSGKIVNQASYGYIADTDRVLPAVPDDVVSYSAPGANLDGIHVCFPGRAGQTRDQWLDEISSAMIDRVAELMRDLSAEHSIPLRRLTVAQIVAGYWGYCDHGDISDAYGRTDHTDVGALFPWDVLAARLRPPSPPEDPDMENPFKTRRVYVPNGPEAHVTIRIRGYKDPNERDIVAEFDEADAIPVTAEQYAALLAVYNA